jgi:hypothetical protein
MSDAINLKDMSQLRDLRVARNEVQLAHNELHAKYNSYHDYLEECIAKLRSLDTTMEVLDRAILALDPTYEAFRTDGMVGSQQAITDVSALHPPVDSGGGGGEVEIPEGFTKWEGGEWTGNPHDAVQVIFHDEPTPYITVEATELEPLWNWSKCSPDAQRIIAFQIIKAADLLDRPADTTTRHAAIEAPPIPALETSDTGEEQAPVAVVEYGDGRVYRGEVKLDADGNAVPHGYGEMTYPPGWDYETDIPQPLRDADGHYSSCAIYNEPAFPAGPCDCADPIPQSTDEQSEPPTGPAADVVALQTYMDGDELVVREITADEFYQPPPVDVTPTDPDADMIVRGKAYYGSAAGSSDKRNPFAGIFGGKPKVEA